MAKPKTTGKKKSGGKQSRAQADDTPKKKGTKRPTAAQKSAAGATLAKKPKSKPPKRPSAAQKSAAAATLAKKPKATTGGKKSAQAAASKGATARKQPPPPPRKQAAAEKRDQIIVAPTRRPMSNDTRNKAMAAGALGAAALAAGALFASTKGSKKAKAAAKPKKTNGKKAAKAAEAAVRFQNLEGRPNADLVNRTIQLLENSNRRTVASLRAVGAHLLEHYFDNDAHLAQSRNPHLGRSWTLLGERAEGLGEWDASDLWSAVTVELVARSLPQELLGRINPADLVRLDSIEDLTGRAEVAGRIARGEVSGRALRDLVAQHAGEGASAGKPGAVRLAGSLERVISRAEAEGHLDEGELASVDEADRSGLRARLESVTSRLSGFLDRMRQ